MATTEITTEMPVGEIATKMPLATRVFARHGIDFCCGGGVALSVACARRGLAPEQVADEIRQELRVEAPTGRTWDEAPLPELVEHILSTYHRPLDEELPRIEAMARKVHAVHRERDPEGLERMLQAVLALRAELEPHMRKEEGVLFPMIVRGDGGMAQGPVAVMRHEHDEAGALLRRLREVTDDYTPPEGACTTWRALWHALAELERASHEHIHLENNILFPRALRA